MFLGCRIVIVAFGFDVLVRKCPDSVVVSIAPVFHELIPMEVKFLRFLVVLSGEDVVIPSTAVIIGKMKCIKNVY